MIAMAVLLVVVVYLTEMLTRQSRAYAVVDQVTETQQNLRAIADLLERELRVTGFLVPEGAAVCGVDQTNGFTASTLEEIPIKKIAADNSNKVILLTDSSKLHTHGLAVFIRFNQVDVVMTDTGIKNEERKFLEKEGIEVICAKRVDRPDSG